jgi:hypothetical protein
VSFIITCNKRSGNGANWGHYTLILVGVWTGRGESQNPQADSLLASR